MPKFPNPPGVAALARLVPAIRTIPTGSRVARVYYSRSRHPLRWEGFRHFGPLNSRWDHHLPDAAGTPATQERSIYYAATDAKTCLAEFFQHTRRIDRAAQSPWLVVFELAQSLDLIDLTGDFATRMGASMEIHSGARARARRWASDLYEAFPNAHGILYASSMNGGALALAVTDRAEKRGMFPEHPLLHRALADDVLLDTLKDAADRLGYALR
jgi:RES domain-containing protein